MTIYAGETITFKTSATDVDDNNSPILDIHVSSTSIEIKDSAGTTVVGPTSMTWDATDQEWRYAWDTTVSGSFTAKMRLVGASFDTWEYKRVNVRPQRAPFT